jgi:hypothetical protein
MLGFVTVINSLYVDTAILYSRNRDGLRCFKLFSSALPGKLCDNNLNESSLGVKKRMGLRK